MKEADIRQKVYRLLRELGYWPITQTDAQQCPNCGTRSVPPIGRPDILVMHPTLRSVVVEVKSLRRTDTSFPFDRITEEQRKWLDRWQEDGGLGYLALGAIRQHGTRDHLENLWLVDWHAWKVLEGLVRPIQASVPLEVTKGMRTALQCPKLDLRTQLASWDLHDKSTGQWQLPEGHTAWPEEVS